MSKASKRERQRVNREARREAEEQWLKRRRMLRVARNVAIPLVLVIAVAVVVSVIRGDDSGDGTEAADEGIPAGCVLDAPPPMAIDPANEYVATVETSEGSFEIALGPQQAPETVNAFVYSARNDCYDGLGFHRVAEDFVIQGGDPRGNGSGDFGYKLPDELPADGYTKGSVAMANAGPGTSGSQFLVVLSDQGAQNLGQGGPPFKYSILGQVTSGFETVETIGSYAPPAGDGPPTTEVTITSITVTENGTELEPTATIVPPTGPEATQPGASP